MFEGCPIAQHLVVAIEGCDLAEVVNILKVKSTTDGQVKQLLVSLVHRVENPDCVDVPLMVAAGLNNPAIIKHLVDTYEVDINFVSEYTTQGYKRTKTPLIIAVRRGNHTTAGMILSLGADPSFADHRGRTALHHAVRRADCRMARLLLANGVRSSVVDGDGQTPLHSAARLGGEELVLLLARYGADLYAKDCDGATVVHIAARQGHSSLVRTLVTTLKMEADLRVTCYDGKAKAPIHVAAEESQSNLIHTLLLWCSANVELTDSMGNTALHYAVNRPVDQLGTESMEEKTISDTVEVLLQFSVPLHVRNQRGETALHLAVRNRLSNPVKKMLSAGCDPLVKDNSGQRPVDLIAKDDLVMRKLIEAAISQGENMSPTGFIAVTPRRSDLPCLSALSALRSKNSTVKLTSIAPVSDIADMTAALQRVQRQDDKTTTSSISSKTQSFSAADATSLSSTSSSPQVETRLRNTASIGTPSESASRLSSPSHSYKVNRIRLKNNQRQPRLSPADGLLGKTNSYGFDTQCPIPAAVADMCNWAAGESPLKVSSGTRQKSASATSRSNVVSPAAETANISGETTVMIVGDQRDTVSKVTVDECSSKTKLNIATTSATSSCSTSDLCKSRSQVKVKGKVESTRSTECSVDSQADHQCHRKHWSTLLQTLASSTTAGQRHHAANTSSPQASSNSNQQRSVHDGVVVGPKSSGKLTSASVSLENWYPDYKETPMECDITSRNAVVRHWPTIEATPSLSPSPTTTGTNRSSEQSSEKILTSRLPSCLKSNVSCMTMPIFVPNVDSAQSSANSTQPRVRKLLSGDDGDGVSVTCSRTVTLRRPTSGLCRPAINSNPNNVSVPEQPTALKLNSHSKIPKQQVGLVSITPLGSSRLKRPSERKTQF